MIGYLLAAALPAAALIAVAVLRRRVVVVSVSGASMIPTLRHGDRLLVRRVAGERLRRGDLVVLTEPVPCRADERPRWMVKRVVAVPGDEQPSFLPGWVRRSEGVVAPGHLVVLGDNPEFSRDSRHFGALPSDRVVGVVLRRLGASG
ncbi:signal peptidase I [Nonomuraea sediminis]|uniref:signal peptidase I n=1 Tax=Nonomuraea sediminis TaxID=2835864 RepID=UPI001BDDC07B|nr:signal peptidase I [Nonomuraea sediminis]